MNACLRELAVADRRAPSTPRSPSSGSRRRVYLSQNDGTLMSVDYAERYPVATFASGPTNSMRGAAFLSGLDDCAVVDIGGTTSDVGMLQHGFPREASVAVEIGGVRTNFRMPDVLLVRSRRRQPRARRRRATIGPRVGRLRADAAGARLRRRRADRDRHRGRRRARRDRRSRSASPGSTRRSCTGASDRGARSPRRSTG